MLKPRLTIGKQIWTSCGSLFSRILSAIFSGHFLRVKTWEHWLRKARCILFGSFFAFRIRLRSAGGWGDHSLEIWPLICQIWWGVLAWSSNFLGCWLIGPSSTQRSTSCWGLWGRGWGSSDLVRIFLSAESLLVELLELKVQLRLLYPNLFSICVNLLKLLREVWQALKEFFYDNDSKHEPFAFSTECFDDKFKGNSLQNIIKQLILDNCSKQFGNSLQEWLGIFVQEAILVEESVQDASIYFLFLHDLRTLEVLQSDNERLDSFVYLMRFSWEDVLEIFVCGLVNLFSALRWTHLLWEQNGILCGQVLYLSLSFLTDSYERSASFGPHISRLFCIELLLG